LLLVDCYFVFSLLLRLLLMLLVLPFAVNLPAPLLLLLGNTGGFRYFLAACCCTCCCMLAGLVTMLLPVLPVVCCSFREDFFICSCVAASLPLQLSLFSAQSCSLMEPCCLHFAALF